MQKVVDYAVLVYAFIVNAVVCASPFIFGYLVTSNLFN